MPGLVDIAPSFRKVKVGKLEVDCPGVSAEGIAYLLTRFPVLREVLSGKSVDLSPDMLMGMAPDAVAAVIACGTGAVNDAAAEKVAASLGVESQFDLLDAIVKETMPGGVGPFVEKLLALGKSLGVESTNIQDGKLPSPLKPLSQPGTPPQPSGK